MERIETNVLTEELLTNKSYVEESLTVHWHRHVREHGPKPKAYALYNISMCAFEENKDA